MKRGAGQAYVALAFLALFWGYSWVWTKIATHDATPMVVVCARCGLGIVALFAFHLLTGRSVRPPRFLPTLVYGLLQTTAFSLMQTIAVSLGAIGKASVLTYTMPFWLALLAWPFLGERITGLRWGAFGLAAVGLALIVLPLRGSSMLVNGIPVLAGLAWAASAIWAIRVRASGGYDLLNLTMWQMVWGTLALAPFALVLPIEVHWTRSFVASIVSLAVFATATGWALWLFALSRLPASVAGIASLATPVLVIVLAALHLHELPSRRELAGIACIITALVVNARAQPVARTAAGAPRPHGARPASGGSAQLK